MKMLPEAASNLDDEKEECNFHTNLLIDDEPLQVLPKLAVAIGLDDAIVVQQLHYWLNPKRKAGKVLDGKRWIYNTYAEWRKSNFPFWTEVHIKRLFLSLEKRGIIVSCQPEGRFSRRKYYRINEGFLIKAKKGQLGDGVERIKLIRSSDQIDPIVVSKSAVPNTETTSRENNQREFSHRHPQVEGEREIVSFEAKWKPDGRSKEAKLASIPTPYWIPSEVEFNDFVKDLPNGYLIMNGRPELYHDLCWSKWHQWKEYLRKWIPIRDWKKYVTALADKMEDDL